MHKLSEQVGNLGLANDPRIEGLREHNKDAFDIYRLLRSVETRALAYEVRLLGENEMSRNVTVEALSNFRELFGNPSGLGTELVVQHIALLGDDDFSSFVEASSVALSEDLLDATSP